MKRGAAHAYRATRLVQAELVSRVLEALWSAKHNPGMLPGDSGPIFIIDHFSQLGV